MKAGTQVLGAGFVLALASLGGCAADGSHAEAPETYPPVMAIHQEALFTSPPQRLYEALTDAAQFAQLTGRPVAELSREPGGAFSLFGGVIVGRQIELVPGQRLVEAWRERTWPDGVYSIVKFEFRADGTGTRLIFDQTGFPSGAGEHLAIGWGEMYWEPMRKFLGE